MRHRLTHRELDIMAVLWRQGSATVGDVKAGVPDKIAYSTVLTILRILEGKGHVRHEQDGKAFRYYAVTKPEQASDSVLQRLVAKVYHGSREMLIARLVSDRHVTAAELKRIRKQLDERLKEMKP
jgi:predicted transcriptional regulator